MNRFSLENSGAHEQKYFKHFNEIKAEEIMENFLIRQPSIKTHDGCEMEKEEAPFDLGNACSCHTARIIVFNFDRLHD